MIPKRLRFPMRADFLSFRSRARKIYSPHLTLYCLLHPPIQLAVVVPKKVNKRAVVRNRLKRLLKQELLNHQLGQIVVLVKPIHLEKNQLNSVAQELSRLLQKLQLQTPNPKPRNSRRAPRASTLEIWGRNLNTEY